MVEERSRGTRASSEIERRREKNENKCAQYKSAGCRDGRVWAAWAARSGFLVHLHLHPSSRSGCLVSRFRRPPPSPPPSRLRRSRCVPL